MDKGNTMIALDELMNEVKTYIQDPDSLALIEKAYRYAQGHHQGQFRRSGEPYMIHAAQVGYILATMKVGPRTICAGPVSYTHLDVYKRQDQSVAGRQRFAGDVRGGGKRQQAH